MVSKALVEDLAEIIKHVYDQARSSKKVSTKNIKHAIESVGFKRIKQLGTTNHSVTRRASTDIVFNS